MRGHQLAPTSRQVSKASLFCLVEWTWERPVDEIADQPIKYGQ